MHIGLIGGIGPAATDHYYRGLIARHAASSTSLDVTIAHADVGALIANLGRGNAHQQAEIFAKLVRRLETAGARAAAVTALGGHFCIRELEARSPLPVLNAISAIDAAVQEMKLTRVGILGTRAVMQTHLYGGITSAQVVAPESAVLNAVHNAYVDMAISGQVTEAHRDVFLPVGQDLCRSHGAEAVVLAGTDLFLAFDGRECGFPVVDGARIHIDMIYRYSRRD